MAKSIKSKLTKADKNCPKLGHFTTNHKEPETQQKQLKKRVKTNDICPTCHQSIYTDVYYDYSGDDGYEKALLDFCLKNKARLAEPIAEAIISMPNKNRRIPPKINDLFVNITKTLVQEDNSYGVRMN